MKKLVSLFCALAVFFGALCAGGVSVTAMTIVYSDGDYNYIVSDYGTALITSYFGKETELVIPSVLGGYPVSAINNAVCKGRENLISVTIPNGVETIGDYAFMDCPLLETIILPGSVTSFGENVFYNTAYYNDGDNWSDGVLYIGRHLMDAKSDLSGSYTIRTGTKVIGSYAFSGCDSLTHVTVPNGVTVIDGFAFAGCDSLARITLPDSVTRIGTMAFYDTAYYNHEANWIDGVLYIGHHLITTKPTICGDYTVRDGTKTIAHAAFADCGQLTGVTMPDSVTTIGGGAFARCSALTHVFLGDGVITIGGSVFDHCESLVAITVPSSVVSIGNHAFWNCSALTDVYYGGSREQWDLMGIGIANESLFNATVHYTYDADEPVRGDLSGDDTVDMRDAFALYAAVAGGEALTDAQKAVADMNGDGLYDMRDAFALYKIASGG